MSTSLIGDRNPATGHTVIDQRGEYVPGEREAIVLAHRAGADGRAEYVTWRCYRNDDADGRPVYCAGAYYTGERALQRAADDFYAR